MTLWKKAYWLAVLERVVRGAAIGALLYLKDAGWKAAHPGNAFELDWMLLLGDFLGGALLSFLFSLLGRAVSKNGPAFTKAEAIEPAALLEKEEK